MEPKEVVMSAEEEDGVSPPIISVPPRNCNNEMERRDYYFISPSNSLSEEDVDVFLFTQRGRNGTIDNLCDGKKDIVVLQPSKQDVLMLKHALLFADRFEERFPEIFSVIAMFNGDIKPTQEDKYKKTFIDIDHGEDDKIFDFFPCGDWIMLWFRGNILNNPFSVSLPTVIWFDEDMKKENTSVTYFISNNFMSTTNMNKFFSRLSSVCILRGSKVLVEENKILRSTDKKKIFSFEEVAPGPLSQLSMRRKYSYKWRIPLSTFFAINITTDLMASIYSSPSRIYCLPLNPYWLNRCYASNGIYYKNKPLKSIPGDIIRRATEIFDSLKKDLEEAKTKMLRMIKDASIICPSDIGCILALKANTKKEEEESLSKIETSLNEFFIKQNVLIEKEVTKSLSKSFFTIIRRGAVAPQLLPMMLDSCASNIIKDVILPLLGERVVGKNLLVEKEYENYDVDVEEQEDRPHHCYTFKKMRIHESNLQKTVGTLATDWFRKNYNIFLDDLPEAMQSVTTGTGVFFESTSSIPVSHEAKIRAFKFLETSLNVPEIELYQSHPVVVRFLEADFVNDIIEATLPTVINEEISLNDFL